MQIIDADGHFTLVKGLEGTPLQVETFPDGGHTIQFNGGCLAITPSTGWKGRPGKPPIDPKKWWDLDSRLEDLDREGIDKQVLTMVSDLFYGAEARMAVRTARKFNDGLAETIATCKNPSRYLGAAHLPLQDPEAAADEAERAVKELKMPVVVMSTNVQGKSIDLPEFWPFFARLNELEVPIIVHSQALSPTFKAHMAAGDRIGWNDQDSFKLSYPIWWMLGHPFEHMIAITRIIYSGLLDRYPHLKFIFEEGNVGYALYLFDRLEEGWEFGEMLFGPRVHLQGPKKRPTDYLEHFHWSVESEDSMVAEVIKRWGAEKILFGTDYPHPDTPWPESVKEMEEALAFCSAEDRAKVLGDNAVRLLHL
jgi:aminocarboxymuconate-semialdehyde decarboxylase